VGRTGLGPSPGALVSTCTLQIDDRVVLTSLGGAPEVEYMLFDPGEIELAATGPGMVQEVGYETTAEDAIARLGDSGVTRELALEAAAAMHPSIAIAYSRGSWARRIATLLGPGELFDGSEHDAKAKLYAGRWLDLPALASDAESKHLTQLVQGLYLVTVLHEVPGHTSIRLSTREHMANARPGGRSHRRYALGDAAALPQTLRSFAATLRSLMPVDRLTGPTRRELRDALRARGGSSADVDVKDRLRAIEAGMEIRERPLRGPLTDPELWALDQQLSAGKAEGIDELIDAVENTAGKGPGTSYLRARAALLTGREPAIVVAERAASLALSMPSFAELELLAAEAWNAAGEPRRALPFARDLISNAVVKDELRIRESQQIPAQSAETKRPERLAMTPKEESDAIDLTHDAIPEPDDPTPLVPAVMMRAAADKTRSSWTAPEPFQSARSRTPTPSPAHAAERPGPSRKETPPMVFDAYEAPTGPHATTPSKVPQATVPLLSMPNRDAARTAATGTWVGPPPAMSAVDDDATAPGGASNEGVPPPSSGRAGRLQSPPVRVTRSGLSDPPAPVRRPRVSTRPPAEPPRLANSTVTELMRGASQPPFRSDSPEAHLDIPKAPAAPHFGADAEAAAALALPEGLSGVPDPIETLPRNVLEARVQFTFLARELGREYDERLGIILRADIAGIEAMQRVLFERYAKRAIGTLEASHDVRRHGAFLSEILARTFGAFWVDIGPSDVGYWAMVVPPSTRVWPFGRILRLIAMQHNERDLVSYFLELQGRARMPPP